MAFIQFSCIGTLFVLGLNDENVRPCVVVADGKYVHPNHLTMKKSKYVNLRSKDLSSHYFFSETMVGK